MMRAFPVLLLLATLSLGVCDDWPTVCHDAQRSGMATSAGPSKGAVVWATELGGSVDGSPIVVGDRVYVGTSHGDFYALNRTEGSVVWKYATAGAIVGGAEVSAGRVFVGSVDCFVHALDATTGKRLWRHRTLRPVLAGPTVVGDRVIFGSMDGTLRAVDAATGKTVWRVEGLGGVSAPVTVQGDALFCGDETGTIAARRVVDGSVVWTAKLSGRVVAPMGLVDGKLLVPLMSLSALTPPGTEFVTAWNVADGTKAWGIPKPGAQSTLAGTTSYQGTLWAFTVEGYTSDGVLRGLRLSDGLQLFENKMGRLVVDGALALAGDTLYMAAENRVLYFMSARTGVVTKQVALGGRAFSSPAVADGRLYVGCQDGKLYCIE